MDIPVMTEFKNYLADRPDMALLALSLSANIFLYRSVIKAKDAHMAALEKWLPLAEKMAAVIVSSMSRRRNSKPDMHDQAPPPAPPHGK